MGRLEAQLAHFQDVYAHRQDAQLAWLTFRLLCTALVQVRYRQGWDTAPCALQPPPASPHAAHQPPPPSPPLVSLPPLPPIQHTNRPSVSREGAAPPTSTRSKVLPSGSWKSGQVSGSSRRLHRILQAMLSEEAGGASRE